MNEFKALISELDLKNMVAQVLIAEEVGARSAVTVVLDGDWVKRAAKALDSNIITRAKVNRTLTLKALAQFKK